jgi:hypothetical protein
MSLALGRYQGGGLSGRGSSRCDKEKCSHTAFIIHPPTAPGISLWAPGQRAERGAGREVEVARRESRVLHLSCGSEARRSARCDLRACEFQRHKIRSGGSPAELSQRTINITLHLPCAHLSDLVYAPESQSLHLENAK